MAYDWSRYTPVAAAWLPAGGGPRRPMAPASPLVIRFGAFGDMVLLTPLLRLLHRRYGAPCTVVGSGGWLQPLLAGHPDVRNTLVLASRKRPYWMDASQRRLVALLRQQAPRPVYVCDDYSIDKIRWLLRRAQVPGDCCAFANPGYVLRPGEHWIERWQRFGAATPALYASTRPPAACEGITAPSLAVSDHDRTDLDGWLDSQGLQCAPLVLLQPGNKRTLKRGRAGRLRDSKDWGTANWAGLIHAVLRRLPDARIILCGAPPESALLRAIAQASGSARVLAAGDMLPLRRLLALCERAVAMVSVDTGPAQAAAALGCPLIVLYGSQPPSLWLPRSPTGSAVIALGGPPLHDHVAQIALKDVADAWRSLPLRGSVPR
ncbi:MAG: lipopolysaccharide heptosyltransferase family protein [Rhodanobacteraceae bacterium]|nr:MAG: lipopolysaccharide heptosyltransferase family protein [Rhodanobacteraceae bacterium]